MPRKIEITTLSSADSGGGGDCMDRITCPGVHIIGDRPDVYYVVVTEVTDRAELAAFTPHIGPGERLGVVPRSVLDRLPL